MSQRGRFFLTHFCSDSTCDVKKRLAWEPLRWLAGAALPAQTAVERGDQLPVSVSARERERSPDPPMWFYKITPAVLCYVLFLYIVQSVLPTIPHSSAAGYSCFVPLFPMTSGPIRCLFPDMIAMCPWPTHRRSCMIHIPYIGQHYPYE